MNETGVPKNPEPVDHPHAAKIIAAAIGLGVVGFLLGRSTAPQREGLMEQEDEFRDAHEAAAELERAGEPADDH